MVKTRTRQPARSTTAPSPHPPEGFRWWREVIESIAVAFILAFLIRSFEAEAFVIPTGSMAPTLLGRHKDVRCPQCDFRYQVGASLDMEQNGDGDEGLVVATLCPMCGFPYQLDPRERVADGSFSGDRIIVDKLAYERTDPQRWDVVVFKFPGNAKQNYIKRLVGLPGETVMIHRGDVYIRGEGEKGFAIARKPPQKLRHILLPVYDSRYVAEAAEPAGWPQRWQPEPDEAWEEGGREGPFRLSSSSHPAWLRYYHVLPGYDQWEAALNEQRRAAEPPRPSLVTDFYAYNQHLLAGQLHRRRPPFVWREFVDTRGSHWVGDLALEASVQVQSAEGQLLLDLVEGGRHFTCRIDVSTGEAELTIDGPAGPLPFLGAEGEPAAPVRKATTSLRGAGSYELRMTNVDDQVLLWVDDHLCTFDGPTTYDPGAVVVPHWSPDDPGDLSPAAIGGQQLEMTVDDLRVLRDIYYVADTDGGIYGHGFNDYIVQTLTPAEIHELFSSPAHWDQADLFKSLRSVKFELERGKDPAQDQFFVLGDNSPESRDGRMWGEDNIEYYVERRLLTGRAVFIYWPHAWWLQVPFTRIGIPIFPQFGRMGIIR